RAPGRMAALDVRRPLSNASQPAHVAFNELAQLGIFQRPRSFPTEHASRLPGEMPRFMSNARRLTESGLQKSRQPLRPATAGRQHEDRRIHRQGEYGTNVLKSVAMDLRELTAENTQQYVGSTFRLDVGEGKTVDLLLDRVAVLLEKHLSKKLKRDSF